MNVVKEEKDGWYMTARNTVRERLDEAIADAKERLTGQKRFVQKKKVKRKKKHRRQRKVLQNPKKPKAQMIPILPD